MKTIRIEKIEREPYVGMVYNVELESDSPSDDLFWIEQNTGIVTHNCFPKDLNSLICQMEQNGFDPKLLKACWQQNLAVRKNRDWEK